MTRHRKRRQWGSGEIHQTSSGWQVRWRENGLRRTRGGFATREDAERVLAKMRGDVARIRAFVEVKLAEKLNPATIRIFIALLSAVFVDLTERGLATGNPARGLPKSLMRLIRPTHDPKKTPFIERARR